MGAGAYDDNILGGESTQGKREESKTMVSGSQSDFMESMATSEATSTG